MAGTSVDSLNISVERDLFAEWKKRKADEELLLEAKRPRQWYFRLESESSVVSEDTESIYSIQDKETDIARDTSDTDTKSESDASVEFEVEYEVASLSETEDVPIMTNSSSGEEFYIKGAIAAALCETSLDNWITDDDSSSSSSDDNLIFGKIPFGLCIQCKSRNDNPYYRYCDRCYQVKKKMFPPRPKARSRSRKRQSKEKNKSEVKLSTLKSCLSGLSQDSGLGSSQEIQSLNFEEIVVPETVKSSSSLAEDSVKSESSEESCTATTSSIASMATSSSSVKRKRDDEPSDEGVSDVESKKQKLGEEGKVTEKEGDAEKEQKSEAVEENKETTRSLINEIKPLECLQAQEPCIMCNLFPKNSIFLHGSIGHMCCCYKCAIKSWRTQKRCPVCNCKVKNVVKVFTV